MAKKRRHRTWWFPAFESETKEIAKTQVIGDVDNDVYPLLFDSESLAYNYALGKRLDVKRDEDGNVITNEQGYAQLNDLGRVTVFGFKGKQLDWKRTQALERPASAKGDAIVVGYNIPLNKQTLDRVFEETEEMYENFKRSPLAQAGGLNYDTNADAAEDLQPTPES